MKLNWGHKLTILTVTFMVFIVTLVTYMIKQDVQLVESDYYEKGIKYQDVLDESKFSANMVSIQLDSVTRNTLNIQCLDSTMNKMSGELHFYRPSDKSKDFNAPVSFSYHEPLSFPVSSLVKGLWKVTLYWEDAKGKHQYTQSISI